MVATDDEAFAILTLEEFELLPPAEKAACLEHALAYLNGLVMAARERRAADRNQHPFPPTEQG